MTDHVPSLNDPVDDLLASLSDEMHPGKQDHLAKRIFAHDPTVEQLIELMRQCRHVQPKAWSRIMELQPQSRQVLEVLECFPDFRIRAAKWLMSHDVSVRNLRTIIELVPTWADAAASILMRGNPTGTDLVKIMKHVPRLRDEAWQLFQTKSRSMVAIGLVLIEVPTHVEACTQLMKQRNIDPQDVERHLADLGMSKEFNAMWMQYFAIVVPNP